MAIGPSILEQEDALKNLPTEALQNMMRQPSPNAPPFLVAAELKRREQMAKEFAGKQAEAKTAASAPTVAQRLSGVEQPMPMSQAGAMAAPPPGPAMPQESQIAMALSGATGQPPPQLPTVNAATGTSGPAVQALVKALQKEGTRSYAQRPRHQPFSSEKVVPAPNDGGLAALIAAILKQTIEPEQSFGGLAVPKEVKLPRGRGGARAAARPVTAANGTQGRTVYAQTGYQFSPEQVLGADLTNINPQVEASKLKALEEAARVRATREDLLDSVGGYFRGGGETGTTQNVLHPVSRNNVPAGAEVLSAQTINVNDGQPQTNVNGSGILSRTVPRSREMTFGYPTHSAQSPAVASRDTERSIEALKNMSPGEKNQRLAELHKEIIEGDKTGTGIGSNVADLQSQALLAAEQKAIMDAKERLVSMADTAGVDIPTPTLRPVEKSSTVSPEKASEKTQKFIRPSNIPNITLSGSSGYDVLGSSKGGPGIPSQENILSKIDAVLSGDGDKKTFDPTEVSGAARKQGDALRERLGEKTSSLIKSQNDAIQKLADADKASLDKIDESFKALKDFQETGKLPQRHRDTLINAGLMKFGAALLDPKNPDPFSAFSAGLEGFQKIEKEKRTEYLDGLKYALTAETAQQKLSMERRNAEAVARRSLAQFQVAQQSRDEAAVVASEDRYIAAANNAQRLSIAEKQLASGKLSALAAILNSIKPGKDMRMLKSLISSKLQEAKALAAQGNFDALNEAFIYDEKNNSATPRTAYFVKLFTSMDAASLSRMAMAEATFRRQEESASRQVNAAVDKKMGDLMTGWGTDTTWQKIIGRQPTSDEMSDDRARADLQRRAMEWVQRRTPGHPKYTKAPQGEKRDPAVVRSGITGN